MYIPVSETGDVTLDNMSLMHIFGNRSEILTATVVCRHCVQLCGTVMLV